MVVDDDAVGLGLTERQSHVAQTVFLREIEAEDEIGLRHGLSDDVGVLVVAHDALCPRQPLEEVGEHIGHAYKGILALAPQIACPSEG